jgi:L-malate glycosyltransferase
LGKVNAVCCPDRTLSRGSFLDIAISAQVDIHALARFMGQGESGIAVGMGNCPAPTALIMELVRRGHRVTLYTLSDGLSGEESYDWGRLRVFAGPNRRFRYLYRPQIAYLKRVIRADAPRFVHAHWTYEFALGPLASGVPTVTTIHDLPWRVLWYVPHISVSVRLLMAYAVAFKGKYFTTGSSDAARHFRRWFFLRAPIELIPNFTGDWIFDLGKTGVPRSDRPFTFVTALQGWSRRKNGKCALRAFHLARRSFPEARLIMIGRDYGRDAAAHAWATSQGLAEGVTFMGEMKYAAYVKVAVQEADVFVHPSLDEALSLATVESMALKKPVIAGNRTPGMHRLLDDGRVGLLVDVRDPKEVARAMEKLAADPELRKTMAEAAFEFAWNNFRAEVVVPQYEAMYQRFDALVEEKRLMRSNSSLR